MGIRSTYNWEDTNSQLAENAKYLYPQIYALRNKLTREINPAVIALQGDSTGNDVNEWFYLFGQWLASKFPNYTVKHALWSDTNQGYETPTIISTGANGKGYFSHTNAGIDHFNIPDIATLHITGDIDLKFYGAADDWTGTANQVLIDKLGSGDARAYSFYINTAGKPVFYWSPDGTAGALKSATSTAAISAADGTDLWVRCTVDVDNGSSGYTVKFYTSPNGVTWTQLGSNVTAAGVTTLYSNTDDIMIGYGSLGKFYGKIYYVEIRNGINGTVVASPDAGLSHPSYAAALSVAKTFSDIQGNIIDREGYAGGLTWGNGSPTLLMLNASVSGQVIAYSADVTRFALQQALESDINFISYSHNENGLAYKTPYLAYFDQLIAKWPVMSIIPVAQNPQTSANAAYLFHNQRCQQIAQMAAARKYLCIDVFTKMTESGNLSSYIDTDGVHPTEAGSQYWCDCVTEIFDLIM